MELVIIILSLLVGVELVTMVRQADVIKELESLERARSIALDNAENKVKKLNLENVMLLGNASEFRQKANVYDEIARIIKSKNFTFDKCEEIKKLVDNLENDN